MRPDMSAKQNDKDTILALRLPRALLRRLDKAAKGADRTRSAEARVRLEQSLREQQPATEGAA
jgi:predicted transcriptional regulator